MGAEEGGAGQGALCPAAPAARLSLALALASQRGQRLMENSSSQGKVRAETGIELRFVSPQPRPRPLCLAAPDWLLPAMPQGPAWHTGFPSGTRVSPQLVS